MLSTVIDQRPSGTRQRLADALGKHRSFVTQITSPAYSTPIPAKHLPTDLFGLPLQPAGARRLPRRLSAGASRQGCICIESGRARRAHLSLTVPDLGDDKQNAALDRAIDEFIHRITSIAGKSG